MNDLNVKYKAWEFKGIRLCSISQGPQLSEDEADSLYKEVWRQVGGQRSPGNEGMFLGSRLKVREGGIPPGQWDKQETNAALHWTGRAGAAEAMGRTNSWDEIKS